MNERELRRENLSRQLEYQWLKRHYGVYPKINMHNYPVITQVEPFVGITWDEIIRRNLEDR